MTQEKKEQKKEDPVMQEIRRFREEYSAMFGDDLHRICEDLRKREASSPNPVVTRPPRKPRVQDVA